MSKMDSLEREFEKSFIPLSIGTISHKSLQDLSSISFLPRRLWWLSWSSEINVSEENLQTLQTTDVWSDHSISNGEHGKKYIRNLGIKMWYRHMFRPCINTFSAL